MTRELLLARRDYFNMVHGVTLRAIAALSDQDLDFRPRARLRTPRELIFHPLPILLFLSDSHSHRVHTCPHLPVQLSRPVDYPTLAQQPRENRQLLRFSATCLTF